MAGHEGFVGKRACFFSGLQIDGLEASWGHSTEAHHVTFDSSWVMMESGQNRPILLVSLTSSSSTTTTTTSSSSSSSHHQAITRRVSELTLKIIQQKTFTASALLPRLNFTAFQCQHWQLCLCCSQFQVGNQCRHLSTVDQKKAKPSIRKKQKTGNPQIPQTVKNMLRQLSIFESFYESFIKLPQFEKIMWRPKKS